MGWRTLLFGMVTATVGLGIWNTHLQRQATEEKRLLENAHRERDEALAKAEALRLATSQNPAPLPAALAMPVPEESHPAQPPPIVAAAPAGPDLTALGKDLAAAQKRLHELEASLATIQASKGAANPDANGKIQKDTLLLQDLSQQLGDTKANAVAATKDAQTSLNDEKAQASQALQPVNQSLAQASGNLALVNQELRALSVNKGAPNRAAIIQQLQLQKLGLQSAILQLKQERASGIATASATQGATRTELDAQKAQANSTEQALQAQIAEVQRDLSYWKGVRDAQGKDDQATRAQAIGAAQAAIAEQKARVTELQHSLQNARGAAQ